MHTFQFTQPKKFKKGTLQKTYGCFETGYPANYCYKSKELMSKYYKEMTRTILNLMVMTTTKKMMTMMTMVNMIMVIKMTTTMTTMKMMIGVINKMVKIMMTMITMMSKSVMKNMAMARIDDDR